MKFTTFCEAQNIRTVALTGQTLSSAAGDVTLDFVGLPTLNNSGHAAFMGRITGPGINNTNDSAILTEGIGGNMVVLPQKEAIFPAGEDHVPVKRFGIPVLSDSGHTVFQAEVNRPISFPLLIFGGGYWRVDEFGAMSSTVIGDRRSDIYCGERGRISDFSSTITISFPSFSWKKW